VRLESNKKPVRSSGGIDCCRTPLCLRWTGETTSSYKTVEEVTHHLA
jgi:hypothetical protein